MLHACKHVIPCYTKSILAADDSGSNPATTRLKIQARFAVSIREGTVSV